MTDPGVQPPPSPDPTMSRAARVLWLMAVLCFAVGMWRHNATALKAVAPLVLLYIVFAARAYGGVASVVRKRRPARSNASAAPPARGNAAGSSTGERSSP
jgi:hypothetical protein